VYREWGYSHTENPRWESKGGLEEKSYPRVT
jgi:hypothetical protein